MDETNQDYLIRLGFSFEIDEFGNSIYDIATIQIYEGNKDPDNYFNTNTGENMNKFMNTILTRFK